MYNIFYRDFFALLYLIHGFWPSIIKRKKKGFNSMQVKVGHCIQPNFLLQNYNLVTMLSMRRSFFLLVHATQCFFLFWSSDMVL